MAIWSDFLPYLKLPMLLTFSVCIKTYNSGAKIVLTESKRVPPYKGKRMPRPEVMRKVQRVHLR